MSSRIYVDEIYPKTTGGAVTFPEKPNFRVGLSAVQSIATATSTKIDLDEADWNIGGHFDLSNSWFKPTVSGYYMVIWNAMVNSSTPDFLLTRIYKNGSLYTDVAWGESNAANMYPRGNAVALVHMNGTSDYVEFYAHHNVGSNTNISANRYATSASGFLVS